MKGGREHRVPLASRAIAIVERLAAIRSAINFSGAAARASSMALRSLVSSAIGATIHGTRSAFRDWCGEETSFPRELAEQALAHSTATPSAGL